MPYYLVNRQIKNLSVQYTLGMVKKFLHSVLSFAKIYEHLFLPLWGVCYIKVCFKCKWTDWECLFCHENYFLPFGLALAGADD